MYNAFNAHIYNFIFFAFPIAALAFFGISLYFYCSAKSENKKVPGTFPPSEMKLRLILLIISSIIMGVLLLTVIGFIALVFMSIAYM